MTCRYSHPYTSDVYENDSPDDLDPGFLIQKARKGRNISQVELSELLGVRQQTLSRWENGIYPVPLKVVNTLVDVTGVDKRKLIDAIHRKAEARDPRYSSTREETAVKLADLEEDVSSIKADLKLLIELLQNTDR